MLYGGTAGIGMYHGTTENSPHKVGVLTVLRKSDYVLVKTECPMEEVVVVVVVCYFQLRKRFR